MLVAESQRYEYGRARAGDRSHVEKVVDATGKAHDAPSDEGKVSTDSNTINKMNNLTAIE